MELKLEKVCYKEKEEILKDLDMIFPEGYITSLIGDNINEILNIVSLNRKPSSGTIRIDDTVVNGKNIKNLIKKIGFCIKEFKEETVKEELSKVLKFYKNKEDEKRIKDTLKMVGLPPTYINRKIDTLSSGEKQKLMLAKVLIHNPKIIILDNPTKDLDYFNRNQLIKLLKLMKLRYKKTIIITTTDTNALLELSDYIYEIEDGRINIHGDKYVILSNETILKRCNLHMPKIIRFSKLVKNKKNINIGYRDNLNDLMKDIYRFTERRK